MSEEKESSVLFNLRELMTLEEDRVRVEEEEQLRREASERERIAAEARERQQEQEARTRAEEEARQAEERRLREEEEAVAREREQAELRVRLEEEAKQNAEAHRRTLDHERELAAIRAQQRKGIHPGLIAAAENCVQSPLLENQIDKQTVRELAKHWNLSVWDKPAMPCLSSRVAYGEEVTPSRLRMIDQAESYLRKQGFAELRVRYHAGDLARVEVPVSDIPRLISEPLRSEMSRQLQDFGFKFVTVDANGFRSGNLNTLIPVDELKRS